MYVLLLIQLLFSRGRGLRRPWGPSEDVLVVTLTRSAAQGVLASGMLHPVVFESFPHSEEVPAPSAGSTPSRVGLHLSLHPLACVPVGDEASRGVKVKAKS